MSHPDSGYQTPDTGAKALTQFVLLKAQLPRGKINNPFLSRKGPREYFGRVICICEAPTGGCRGEFSVLIGPLGWGFQRQQVFPSPGVQAYLRMRRMGVGTNGGSLKVRHKHPGQHLNRWHFTLAGTLSLSRFLHAETSLFLKENKSHLKTPGTYSQKAQFDEVGGLNSDPFSPLHPATSHLCSISFLPSKFSLAQLLPPFLVSPGSLQLWRQSEGLRRCN